jgi:hypothetical protein
MVSPVHGDYRRCQAEIPLIVLCRFPGPALYAGKQIALQIGGTITLLLIASFAIGFLLYQY